MQTCPSCGEENPDRFRLCGYCGTALVTAAQPRPQEVRKTVTVVFCDLKDSTALGDRLDSEALREVLALYFSAMKPVLEGHGGTIEKYIGDAIMAIFGLPRMHEDDAQRAVRAAVTMREALAELNVTLRARFGVTLENRTGVNTGEVVAGDTGDFQRLATGDTVNVAARLEQAAPVGEVLIGESTHRLVRDVVEAVPVEPLELKGKPEPVPAYRLLSVSAAERSARAANLPVVGRAREIAALDAEFRRSVAGPEGRLVTLLGEAGVGKSRLIEEFVRIIADEAVVLQSRCLSYGDGITFWPLAEVFRQAAGIVPEDDEEDARGKLASRFGEGMADATSRIESVMGLSERQYGKDELFWAVRAVLQQLVRRRPLVVVFDDIQWAEPTFLDLIEQILDASLGVPLLLVCGARHEFREDRPGFAAGRRTSSQIELEELSPTESGLVVRNLLGEASLPGPLSRRILRLAEGNPLFIEQMLSMLIDDGLLREQAGRWVLSGAAEAVSVPGNVSSLLGARLDRLEPAERMVVASASVIGLEFSSDAVSVLVEESEARTDLGPPLAALCRKQLIRRTEPGTADDFRFSHILIRDTAYARLLKRTRARLHERYAAWLTDTFRSRLAEYEEFVGYHLEQSFRYRGELGPVDDHGRQLGDEASRYLRSAGHRALVRGDLPAAAGLLQRAAALLAENDPARALLLLDAGEAAVDLGELERAESMLAEAVDRALSTDDAGTARAAALALLQLRYTTDAHAVQQSVSQHESVVELVEWEIADLEALGDDRALVRAFRLLAQVHGTAGRYADAAAAAERTIRHATAADDEVTARRFLSQLAISALYGPMPVPEAIATCEEVLARAEDDRKARALTELYIVHLEAMRGDFDRARLLYRRSRASLEEFGYHLLAALTSLDSSVIELLAGDPAAAESELRADYRRLEEMGERNYISTTAGLLADVLYRQGRYEESAAFAGECEHLASPDDVASQFHWRCVRGKLKARQGAADEAESLVSAAMALVETSDQLDLQGNGLLDFAEIRELAGIPEDAAALADRAARLFERKGNVVSARRARLLGERLRSRPAVS
ncbi:MAG TPA: adenylate/guanylate cyclase domain-containing protein [Acidimicrobiales bacterium]|nr:adenylate/guanylate cyclase domain-containing protein [Acidimicrobiales bacterium]